MVQVQSGVVLPIRIFINRQQVAKTIQDSSTSFETPLLPNNSIIRLKSPLIRVYLSNTDARDLCNDIKKEILLIIYELTSKDVHDTVTGKLKIGNCVDIKEAFGKTRAFSFLYDSDPDRCNLTTLERIGKHQYKLHYDKNWELDIFITDLRKLARIRSVLLARMSWQGSVFPGAAIPVGDLSGTRILRRCREEIMSKKSPTDEPSILLESDDEGALLDTAAVDSSTSTTTRPLKEADLDEDKKPAFKFIHSPMVNLGNCIDIHVLKRPKRARTNRSQAHLDVET
ncbi:DNA-binding protein SAW1 [Lachancea thermotolerans CBS 6340]|uniref:KLTH0D02112p n=1 Tax=Lachancea thermotolerans (strain ATCC 56472 / CBS 6340 / NRRL Y-8284) TaxID=559295 RepID=C5DG36_LACTC|nr:KLTH0D02112p [Lachancea thermotolerans CBS 6340]CAR22378.1 KLTH0D02112p [Lachancea thermotolerans CBS 6340]